MSRASRQGKPDEDTQRSTEDVAVTAQFHCCGKGKYRLEGQAEPQAGATGPGWQQEGVGAGGVG